MTEVKWVKRGPQVKPIHEVLAMFEPVTESGCWIWSGSMNSSGYGQVMIARKYYKAHRLFYESIIGPIPEDREIDHLCRVRCCVNPAHLEVVPSKVNTLRGIGPTAINASKTHCTNGHPFDGRLSSGYRYCLICNRARNKKHYYKNHTYLLAQVQAWKGAAHGSVKP